MNIATLTQGLSVVAWLAAGAAFFIIVARAARNQPVKNSGIYVVIPLVLAILLTTTSMGLVFIQPDERGVVVSAVAPQGYRDEALTPGLRFIIPFAENVVRYSISKQTYTMSIASSEGQIQGDDSITARTADGQEIYVDASVIFALDPNEIVKVHIAWQGRYATDLVRPLTRGVIRDVVSQYGVEQVVSSKRLEMVSQITDILRTKLEDNGLLLGDFVLRNITFSPEYAASVEQKQIAEQQAQQAALLVEKKKQEAEQVRQEAEGIADAVLIKAKKDAEARIVAAQAEAQALELIAQVLRENPELLTYQYISKLSPNVQVMFLPSDSPFIFPLPEMYGPLPNNPAPTPVPTPEPAPATP